MINVYSVCLYETNAEQAQSKEKGKISAFLLLNYAVFGIS